MAGVSAVSVPASYDFLGAPLWISVSWSLRGQPLALGGSLEKLTGVTSVSTSLSCNPRWPEIFVKTFSFFLQNLCEFRLHSAIHLYLFGHETKCVRGLIREMA
jgi:hypothetical protein